MKHDPAARAGTCVCDYQNGRKKKKGELYERVGNIKKSKSGMQQLTSGREVPKKTR